MLRLFTATALCGILLLSITPASAAKFGCNPAIQNWQNGSKDTCPYGAGNAFVSQKNDFKASPDQVVEKEPVEDVEEEANGS